MKPSERYNRDAGDLKKFREAFLDLAIFEKRHGEQWIGTTHWRGLRQRAALASGPATDAYGRHGRQSTRSPFGGVHHPISDFEKVDPDDVLSSVDKAIARAERASADAQQRERGLTGVIAAFLRWPSTLREAVDPKRTGQAKAAAALGYLAQIVVGVSTSLIAAGLIWLALKVLA